jgi:hypothetical protein
MATTDPRTTIRTGIVNNLGNIKKDDGAANASVIHIWEGGPETLKYLFYTANYDVVLSYGEPHSRGERRIQDVPIHYYMVYPVTVTTADKPLTGVLVCTAALMQYKVTYALRAAVKAFAQSAPAATPAYTVTLISDDAVKRIVGGITVWETKHSIEYETDYG